MGFFSFGNKEKITETTVDSIVKSGTEHVLSLREKIWKIEVSPKKWAKFFNVHRKNFAILGACLVAFISAIFFFSSSADVATFYPTSCLGGWENPKNAEGPPDLNDHSPLEDFNTENSAVLKDSNAEFYCGGFEGAIPQDSFPKTAVLKLSWSVDSGDVDHSKKEKSDSSDDSSVAETESIEIQTEDNTNAVGTTEGEDLNNTTQNENTSVEEGSSSGEVPGTEQPQETPPPSEPEPQTQSFFPLIPVARAEDEVPKEDTASSPSSTPEMVPEAPAEPVSENTESDTATTSEITVIDPPESDNPSSDESVEQTIITPSVVDDFMEIAYTEDGANWQSLVRISRSSWQTGEYSLPIDLSKWENINNFQIRLIPITTIDTPPTVYLDGMSVEVMYEVEEVPIDDAPTVKIIDPTLQIISGEESNVSSSSPEFTVIDPDLSTNDLLDLVGEGKAEVIEDKTGVFDRSDLTPENLDSLNNILPSVLPSVEQKEEAPPPPESSSDGTTGFLYEKFLHIATIHSTLRKFAAIDAAFWQTELAPHLVAENKIAKAKNYKNIIGKFFSPAIAYAQNVLPPVRVKVFTHDRQEISVRSTVTTTFEGGRPRYHISLERPREFRPGKFRMEVTIRSNGANIVSEQDFSWGVLTINIDRSIESPGEDAYLQFGVLDDGGHTICTAELDLEITGPTGSVYNFSTSDQSIVSDTACGPDNVINTPDYYAHFTVPNELGDYAMKLVAHTDNGEKTVEDHFQVAQNNLFDVRRVGPTRIYPAAVYPVTLYIRPTVNWQGTITETVPASFVITPPQQSTGYDSITTTGNEKIIKWNVALIAGEETRLGYYFDAPDISPEFFLIGKAKFYTNVNGGDLPANPNFQEGRQWQIASDAVCIAAGSGNWTTITWTNCGAGPTSADSVQIPNGFSVTLNTSPTITTIDIQNGGTLTNDANARTLTLTGTSGTLFTLGSTGTFTPSTFITVTMNPNASITTTSGTITFYDLNFTPTIATSGKTYTMGSGALTINGNFNINPTAASALALTVNMGANITVDPAKTFTITRTTSATTTLDVRPASTDYNISAGLFVIGTGATLDCTSSASTLTLTGTSGTLFTKTGTYTITSGTPAIIVTSASGTPTLLSATSTLYDLTINSAATVINQGAFVPTINHNFTLTAGVYNASGAAMTGPGAGSGTFSLSAGTTYCLGGTTASTNATCDSGATDTTGRSMPTFQTYSLNATSTVIYLSNATTTVTAIATPGYGDLTIRPVLTAARTYTLGNSLLVQDVFLSTPTSSTTANRILTINVGTGTNTISGAVTLTGRTTAFTGSTTMAIAANTISMYSVDIQSVGVASVLSFTTGTLNLTGTSGTLLTRGGTFTQSTGTVVYKPDASVTLVSNATITFYNLDLLPVIDTTNRTYTFGTGAVTIASGGRFTINPTAANASSNAVLTVSMGAAITVNATSTTTIKATQVSSSTVTSKLDAISGSNRALSTGFLAIQSGGGYLAQASTITLTGTTAAATLFSLTGTGTFTAGTGTVTITGVTNSNIINSSGLTGSNALNNLTINSTGVTKSLGADLTATGLVTITLGTLDTDVTNNYALTMGKISIANSASAIFNARNSTVTLTGTTSTLFTRGASGVFTQGDSNVVVTAAGASSTGITLMSGTATFHILTINVPSTVVINAGAAITTDNDAGNKLYIQAGAFNDGGSQITAGTAGTLQVDSGAIFCLGGAAAATTTDCNATATATTATTFPTFTTVTLDAGSTVSYVANAAQTVSVQTYGNLNLTPRTTSDRAYTISAGTLTINGNFTLSSTTASAFKLSVTLGGTTTVASTKITTVTHPGASGGAGSLLTVGSNTFSTGKIQLGETGGCGSTAKCTIDAGTGTITLTGTSGTLITRTGSNTVFTQGTSEVIVGSASGSPTLLSTATTFHRLTVNSTATVINAGAVITMSNANAANRLYIQNGVLNDGGNTIVGTSNGTLLVDGGDALCISGTAAATNATCDSGATPTSASTFPTNYTNGNITLAATSTVYYLADGTQTVSSTPTYGNLILSPILTSGRTYTFGGAMTINGSFTINPTAASALLLTVNPAGTITVATTQTTTISATSSATSTLDLRPSGTDYNISTGNMTIGAGGTLDGTSAASVITVADDWSNAGTFTAGNTEVILNSAATAAVGGGPTTFYKLTITHTAAKEVDFSTNALHIIHVTNLFSVSGSIGNLIKLYSSSGGTKWHFHPTGTATVDYADVKDGGCESGAISIVPTNSTNSNNNDSCWVFSATATFSISDTTVGFGSLSASAARYATGDTLGDTGEIEAHTLTATTNATYGYTILVNGTTLTSGGDTIAAIGGTNVASSVGTNQFGLRMTASGGSGSVSVPYAASGFALDTGSFPDEIASAASGDGVATVYSVRYLANISNTKPPGSYTATLTYIMVPSF